VAEEDGLSPVASETNIAWCRSGSCCHRHEGEITQADA
jgi:hypothetical protein